MARAVFFQKQLTMPGDEAKQVNVEAAVNFDEAAFGTHPTMVSPWTVSINDGAKDLGRMVGYEGEGQLIIGMHQLKPDISAKRGCEMTVFRMSVDLVNAQLDAPILTAFERWLLKRGWRGDLVKKLKFTNADWVVPIRTFWVKNGYELVLAEEGKWDEHVVKRWR